MAKTRNKPRKTKAHQRSVDRTKAHRSITERAGKTKRARASRLSAEDTLAELKRRLLDISDLGAASSVLSWDQATYMPKGGAAARGRQSAILQRLAHERLVDPALGRLIDALAAKAASLSDDNAALVRVVQRGFEKAIKVPAEYVVRATVLGAASYDAWTRARPANDFAAMVPFLEQILDISREYADFFAPYENIADPF